jgi:hypothetical protein
MPDAYDHDEMTLYRVAPMLLLSMCLAGQKRYDLVLRGGHVIDTKNGLSAVRDVAIRNGAIAAIAPRIDVSDAVKVVDLTGLYVSPAWWISTFTPFPGRVSATPTPATTASTPMNLLSVRE